MSNYKFGCAKVDGKPAWLVQNASKANSAQEDLGLNEVGEPVVAHYFQKVSEMTFEVIIPESESYIPEVGSIFSYGGVKWYITGANITETNTDFNRYSLSCKRFITTNLPGDDSSSAAE